MASSGAEIKIKKKTLEILSSNELLQQEEEAAKLGLKKIIYYG